MIPGSEDPLQEEMATQVSILAWKIPPNLVGYSLWGSQRVGRLSARVHARARTHTHTHTHTHLR